MSLATFPDMTWPVPRGVERYRNLMALNAVARKMTQFGIRVDQRRCQWHADQAAQRAAQFREMFLAETKLPEAVLGAAGAGQTHAVRDWFWKENGAPHLSFKKRTRPPKPQFNSPTLLAYAVDYKDTPYARAAAALLGLRYAITAGRFASAYLAVSSRYGGRIHFGFNPAGTKGERWSSSAAFRWKDENGERVEYSLNAQNVPSKEPTFEFQNGLPTKLALSLRDCFIPDPGCVIGKADYDQQELRLIAYNAGAKRLMDWIASGADPHMENAKLIFKEFKLPADAKKTKKAAPGTLQDVINRAREAAKPCQYAISYQDSTDSRPGKVAKYPDLYKNLKKSFPDLSEQLLYEVIVPRFFAAHPEIKQWQWNTRRALEELGRIELKSTGAFLYLPNTPRGRNQALNYQMQSGGGAIINRAIPLIASGCTWLPNASAILLNVHDELDVQAPIWDANRIRDLVEEHMGTPMQIGETFTGIPAAWDPGWNWNSNISYKEFFAPDGAYEQRLGSAED
jgi:hypothetical protein